MADTILEQLRRRLDSEVQSETLSPLPTDFYSGISKYTQTLKRSAGSGISDVSVHLIATQQKLIESMVLQLLTVRTRKALKQNGIPQLLAEERYVCSAEQRFQQRLRGMVQAVAEGQPAMVEFAHLHESRRNLTVKFVKHVNEVIGLDLRHYGPFEPEDIASIPVASADILIAGGDAVEISTRDDA